MATSVHNVYSSVQISFLCTTKTPKAEINKRTIAFYPAKQSSTQLRWQTINDFDKRIEFSDIGGDKRNILINKKKVLVEIQKFLRKEV